MHVNILQARTALMRENVALNEIINREGASTSAFDQFIGDEALQGEFYNAAKTYVQFVAKPLYERYIRAAKAKIQANMHYDSELAQLSAYGLVIDLERLLQKRDLLRTKIHALEQFSDSNVLCFLAGYSTLDRLYNISMQLERAIAACYRFQGNTAGCYDYFNSCVDEVSCGLAAAKSVCGVNGGMYRFSSIAARNWAKLTGSESELRPSFGEVSPGVYSYSGEVLSEDVFFYDENGAAHSLGDSHHIAIAMWNKDHDTELSCTFYTLRRLRERGLDFPFTNERGSFNASEWFDKCNLAADYKRQGIDGLGQLVDQYGPFLKNIVVVFPANVFNEYYGHVMLIDEVFEEDGVRYVKYSDNNPRIDTDPTITNPQQTVTFDQFIKGHSDIYGSILIGSND